MPRLSDRAFQIIKNEIDRYYTETPADPIERAILLARLQTLCVRKGKPLTRTQLWEEISDIAPNLDQNVLIEAANVDTDSPVVGASIGIGAVAMLVSTAVGMETVMANAPATTPVASERPSADSRGATRLTTQSNSASSSASGVNAPKVESNATAKLTANKKAATKTPANRTTVGSAVEKNRAEGAFERAKAIGWQAALKSQNPPHSLQHWTETAALWQQAIAELNQILPEDPGYVVAQDKKAIYQQNLQQIQARQQAAQVTAQSRSQTTAQANVQTTGQSSSQRASQPSPRFTATSTAEEDPIKLAKRYGWQAAVAGQNAPHPPEKWADISRLWQTALLNLNKVEVGHPDYAEAQVVKTRYRQNLSAVRQRYQQEQSSAQQLESLKATLVEINQNFASSSSKYNKLTAIAARLHTIPAGTEAHQQAQQLIAETTEQIREIAANPSSNFVLSAND